MSVTLHIKNPNFPDLRAIILKIDRSIVSVANAAQARAVVQEAKNQNGESYKILHETALVVLAAVLNGEATYEIVRDGKTAIQLNEKLNLNRFHTPENDNEYL